MNKKSQEIIDSFVESAGNLGASLGISKIVSQIYALLYLSPQPLSLDDMRKLVFFTNPKYKTFVMLEKQRLCGYVLLTRYKSREAYDGTAEVTIYLHLDTLGKGLGSLALTSIEEIARQQQFHVLIGIICGENSRSINLFEKHGYTKCAHYREVGKKFGRWLDVVDYQKILE